MTTSPTAEICTNCAEPIHFAAPAGTTPIQRDLYTLWRHVATGSIGCVASNQSANPAPRCANCAGRNVVRVQEAWGDAIDCPDCGHHEFFSLGD